MGQFGHFFDSLIEQRMNEVNGTDILNEVSFTNNKDKYKIDAYLPNTYEKSLVGTPLGAYAEIYDSPSYINAERVLRINFCYGWIITNHKGKDGKKPWIVVTTEEAQNINNLMQKVINNGLTIFQNLLMTFKLPPDWPMPDFTKMIPVPDDKTKDKIVKAVNNSIEKARKEKAEAERKAALRKKYYGDY